MPDVWRIYRIKNCRYTNPHKNKFVVIVCKDTEYMGFLVNSAISPYISNRPAMLECQIILSKSDYGCLFHDSYLNCAQTRAFGDAELVIGLELVNEKTKSEIKTVVAKAKTIENHYRSLILNS